MNIRQVFSRFFIVISIALFLTACGGDTTPTATVVLNTPTVDQATSTISPTNTSVPTSAPEETAVARTRPIFVGDKLAKGYDMGVNTSGGLTNWLAVKNGEMCMTYPAGQDWGAVFITVGPPTEPPHPSQDLSGYQTISLEMKGIIGQEKIQVGLKDSTWPNNGSEPKKDVEDLTTDWKTFTYPLAEFAPTDLHNIYVVTEFVFADAASVCARNIQLLP